MLFLLFILRLNKHTSKMLFCNKKKFTTKPKPKLFLVLNCLLKHKKRIIYIKQFHYRVFDLGKRNFFFEINLLTSRARKALLLLSKRAPLFVFVLLYVFSLHVCRVIKKGKKLENKFFSSSSSIY
jgi:hypothetical protein